MKTTKTKSNKSELQSRPEHPITGETDNTTMQQPPAVASSARVLPYVNFEQREQNRSLSTGQVLDLLRQWLPEQFHLAEVVGKWIWITFPEPPAEKIRGQLSQFGFHSPAQRSVHAYAKKAISYQYQSGLSPFTRYEARASGRQAGGVYGGHRLRAP